MVRKNIMFFNIVQNPPTFRQLEFVYHPLPDLSPCSADPCGGLDSLVVRLNLNPGQLGPANLPEDLLKTW